MNEYELIDGINGAIGNALASQALFITTLSAYIVTAYAAGRNLTKFQAGFISGVFVIFTASISFTWINMAMELRAYSIMLDEVRGRSVGLGSSEIGMPIALALITVRALMVLGALAFMWSVRHPKAE